MTRHGGWLRWVSAGAALCALATGCGDDGHPPVIDERDNDYGAIPLHRAQVRGAAGAPTTASRYAGVFTIPVTVGATSATMVIDTGSPITFLDPATFSAVGGEYTRQHATLELAGVGLVDAPVVMADPFAVSPDFGGTLGGMTLCQFVNTWDFRARTFTLGGVPSTVETDGTAIVRPVSVRGGAVIQFPDGSGLQVPPTRLLVDATVEGMAVRLLVDSGASTVALRDDLYAQLVSDGRATITVTASEQGGATTERVARARVVEALGARRDAPVVVSFPAARLLDLSREIGTGVDGLLGIDFFEAHMLTIDYPAGRITLRPYRDTSHVRDRFRRVGIFPRREGSRVLVGSLLPGSDAERQGVRVGATLGEIDHQTTTGLSIPEIDDLLLGAPGEMRQVLVDGRTMTLRVDDVLALPDA